MTEIQPVQYRHIGQSVFYRNDLSQLFGIRLEALLATHLSYNNAVYLLQKAARSEPIEKVGDVVGRQDLGNVLEKEYAVLKIPFARKYFQVLAVLAKASVTAEQFSANRSSALDEHIAAVRDIPPHIIRVCVIIRLIAPIL